MSRFIKPKRLPFSYSILGYLSIVSVIVLPWFLKANYLFLTDTVWGPNIRLDPTNAWFIFNLAIKGLSYIFPIDFLEKIYISSVLFLVLMGGRLLVETISELFGESDASSRGLVFVLSLFALFNPFVYDRALYGQFSVLIAYGCLLFVTAYLLKSWRRLDFIYLYRAGIFTALALMFSVHFIFLLAPFYILYSVGLCLNRQKIKTEGKQKELLLSMLISIVIVLLINANWLLAIVFKASPLTNFGQGITSGDFLAFQTTGRTQAETLTNVLFMSGFWGKDQLRYLDLTTVPGWQRSYILLLPIIVCGAYLSFRKRDMKLMNLSVGLVLIFLMAVMLAIGIKSPVTRGITMFLYDHLPYYIGLREPQKWVAVIVPIYLFYLTLGSMRLSRFRVIMNNRLISGIALGAIIIMQSPSLLWGFNRQVLPTAYPSDWYEVDKLIIGNSSGSKACSDRILFLPWHMYMSFGWVGNVIANPASQFFSCPVLSGTNMEWGGIYDNSGSAEGEAINSWITRQGRDGLPALSDASIRYIILAKEVDFEKYKWLKDLSYVRLLVETKTLYVYEVQSEKSN